MLVQSAIKGIIGTHTGSYYRPLGPFNTILVMMYLTKGRLNLLCDASCSHAPQSDPHIDIRTLAAQLRALTVEVRHSGSDTSS